MSIMPLVNPLVIAPLHLPSFTNHCAVYMCLANANVEARPSRPPPQSSSLTPSLPHTPALPFALSHYTHHCQCTISSLFIGPAQRSPLIIARNAGADPDARVHTHVHVASVIAKNNENIVRWANEIILAKGRVCVRAISHRRLFWPT